MRFESRKSVKMRFAAAAPPRTQLWGHDTAVPQSPDLLIGSTGGAIRPWPPQSDSAPMQSESLAINFDYSRPT